MTIQTRVAYGGLVALILVVFSPGVGEADDPANRSCNRSSSSQRSIAVQWNSAALQGIRDAKLGAPVVARALAIVHTCMYDAWAACDERAVGTQLGGAPRRPASERTLANKEQAINRSLFRERLRGGHSTMAVPGSG